MIEVIRNKDKLNREVWRFSILINLSDQIRIRLVDYSKQTRETTRHKFRKIYGQNFDKYESMNNRWYTGLTIEETPLPTDVLEEVKQKFFENIKFDII